MTMIDDSASSPALDLAAELAARLAAPTIMPLRPQDEPLLSKAEAFSFGPERSRRAWSIGTGPLVLLVHGYRGRGVQMAPIAADLAQNGFRCVYFDAGGHGASRPEPIGFNTLIDDVRDLSSVLASQIYALVGHSAGGLAMMRARALHGISAQKYVMIAAPFFPYVPLESLRQTGASEEALDHIKALLSQQFRTSWSRLSGGEAYEPEAGKPVLAIYDRDDPRVRHADAERIASLWPQTAVLKTSGHGHNRILKAPETIDAVRAFLV